MTDEIRTTQTKKQGSVCAECHEGVPCARHGRKLKVCDLCHRQQVIERLTARKIKRTLTDGCLVLYHRDGWRVGYLVSLGLSAATVQPLGGLCGAMPGCIRIPLSDIKPEIITSAKLPLMLGEYYEMKKTILLVADRSVPAYPPMSEAERAVLTLAIVERPNNAVVEEVPVQPKGKFTEKKVTKSATVSDIKTTPATPGEVIPVVMGTEPKSRMKHLPVDLIKARALYEAGASVNDVVTAVKGTRAEFDVKKLIRKTFKEAGILKAE